MRPMGSFNGVTITRLQERTAHLCFLANNVLQAKAHGLLVLALGDLELDRNRELNGSLRSLVTGQYGKPA